MTFQVTHQCGDCGFTSADLTVFHAHHDLEIHASVERRYQVEDILRKFFESAPDAYIHTLALPEDDA